MKKLKFTILLAIYMFLGITAAAQTVVISDCYGTGFNRFHKMY